MKGPPCVGLFSYPYIRLISGPIFRIPTITMAVSMPAMIAPVTCPSQLLIKGGKGNVETEFKVEGGHK